MSSSSNPRKFSEKIAILTRKQNEDQKDFERIMEQVRPLTHNAIPSTSQGLGPPHPGMWPRPGGSLPNVHEMVQPGAAMAIPHVDPAYMAWPPQATIWPMNDPQRVIHPSQRARSPGSPHAHTYHPYGGVSPPGRTLSPRHRSPDRTMGPPMFPQSLTSPFPPPLPGVGQQLLEIPGDGSWRRTHSDPGINATLGAVQSLGGGASPSQVSPGHSPPQMHTPPSPQAQGSNFYLEPKEVGPARPQSCENSPNIPTLNVTQNNGTSPLGLMISSSTMSSGSLPDLPSQVPMSSSPVDYSQSTVSSGMVPQPPPYGQQNQGSHLQRHSIQFPVRITQEYSPQQQFSTGQYCNLQTNSPSYTLAATPPYGNESHSAPNSPSTTGGQGDSSSSPVPSPGSVAIGSMTTNLKNFTMDNEFSANPQQQAWYQQQLFQQVMQEQYNQHNQQQHMSAMQQYSGQQTLSPKGGIPNIILTGDDGSVRGAATTVAQMTDASLDDFSDLNLDPHDLQLLMNNAVVDADDEDALRRDS